MGKSSYTKKPQGVCHNCGKPGHWKNECPEKDKNGSNQVSQGRGGNKFQGRNQVNNNNGRKQGNGKQGASSWQKKEPGPSEPQTKVVDGKTVHWCKTCGRWTLSHGTAEHRGREGPAVAALWRADGRPGTPTPVDLGRAALAGLVAAAVAGVGA